MSCWCGIELDTPATILKDGNDYYDAGTDVFAEVIDTAVQTFDNETLFKKALWWRFRNYIIGACDTEFWVQGMADRLDMVGRRWDEIFSKMLETDLTDLTDRAYNRTVKHTAIDGTDGDVRVVTREGTDTLVNSKTGQDVEVLAKTGTDTMVDSKTGFDTETLARTGTDTLVDSKTGQDTHTTEHESLPQTLTDATKYLDSRQTEITTPGVETTDETTHDTLDTRTVTPGVETTDETTHNTTDTRTVTPGVETTDETTHDTTDTDTYKPNTQDYEQYEESDTLNAVTFDSMVKAYPNVFIDFTDEFVEYFVSRWYRCRLVRYHSISSRAAYPAGNTRW